MVYYRFILCLLLVQLTSLNVSRITVDAVAWPKWLRWPTAKPAQKKAAPKQPAVVREEDLKCKDNIGSLNVTVNKDKLAHCDTRNRKDKLTCSKKKNNTKLVSFEVSHSTPFCVSKFVGVKLGRSSNGDLTGLPVNKPIRKMRIYHCKNAPRVFYFSTVEHPDGEWFKISPGTNNFVPFDDLKGQNPDKANQCQIASMISTADCSVDVVCPQDLPKYNKQGKVKRIERPVNPYIKYTFTPERHRGLAYDGRSLTWTDKHRKTFKALTVRDIDEVSVYYWEVKNDTRPLLLELKKKNVSTFYRNLGDGGDTKWQLDTVADKVELEDVLDDGNCYLNNALGADITFAKRKYLTADFCTRCRMRANFKEESVKTVESNEIMYNYFFGIDKNYQLTKIRYDDAITNKRTSITIPNLTLPTANVLSFRLYYCNHNPALIYTEDTAKKGKWYRRKSAGWEYLKNLDNKTPSNATDCDTRREYTKMLQELGCSFKPGTCTVPPLHTVTVDISQNPDTKSYVPNTSTVEVRVSEPSEIDDFQKIVHTTSKGTFDLSNVHHASTVTNIPAAKQITGVEVYYWKFDEDYAGPLLVKLSKSGGDLWYENTGVGENKNAGWNLIAKKADVSTEKNLTEKLKVVNCKINHAYTFDLSMDKNYKSFCLDVKVEVTNDVINDLGYTKYAHNTDVVPFTLLALNKPPNDDMELPYLTGQPMRNVSGVYVFKPHEKTNPALLYLETADRANSRWYSNLSEEEEDEAEEEEEEGEEEAGDGEPGDL